MYSDSSGRMIYCDGPMTKSAKEGDTAATSGCSNPYPGPTYTPYPGGWEGQYPGQCSDGVDNDNDGLIDSADTSCTTPPIGGGSCPSGFHSHGESGGFCMNDQENYGGICYSADGKTKITCPSQPTGQCAPPQWWDTAKGYCVGSTSPSPWPSPGTTSCPAGYHFHGESGGFCMNDREDYSSTCYTADGKSTTTCPKSTYPSPQTCPSGQWWDYAKNACVSSTATYTPYPSCPSGQWWDSVSNSCKSTTAGTYTPAPSCPSGQWWDYAKNACSGSVTYTPAPYSCASGWYWDQQYNSCKQSSTTTYTPYPTTQYTPYPSCPSGQWWDSISNSCQGSATIYTPYPTTTYTPPPEYSPPPPTSGALYNHFASIHCVGLDRVWDGRYCQPEGFIARTIENTWANLGKLIGF